MPDGSALPDLSRAGTQHPRRRLAERHRILELNPHTGTEDAVTTRESLISGARKSDSVAHGRCATETSPQK
jgi:hypothetical protein